MPSSLFTITGPLVERNNRKEKHDEKLVEELVLVWNVILFFVFSFFPTGCFLHSILFALLLKQATSHFNNAARRAVGQRGVHLHPHAHSGERKWDTGTTG